MDRLEKLFDERLQKIEMLEEFLVLVEKKTERKANLLDLKEKNSDVKYLNESISNAIKHFHTVDVGRYKRLLADMQEQQLMMLQIIEALDEQLQSKTPIRQPLQLPNQLQSDNFNNTPRMSLQQYQQSPFVKKIKPTTLFLTDFEANIKPEEFARVPQYMKGRESLDELQHFLTEVIIKCFTAKYTLMHKHRDAVRNMHDIVLWKLYHNQVSYFPDRNFITQGDIFNLTEKKFDKKMGNRMAMLRHIKIVQEIRKNSAENSAVCYIWIR